MASAIEVAIIGAGVGGCTLGRCLQQHGINYTIIEKAANARRNDHAITLKQRTLERLESILKISRADIEKAAAIHGTSRAPNGDIQVHRGQFESFLGKDLNIQWESEAQSVHRQDGIVHITYDGSKVIKAPILAAADSVHSSIRKHLIPDLAFDIVPFVAYNGKRKAAADSKVLAALAKTTTGSKQVLVGTTLLQLSSVRPGAFRYTYSRPAKSRDDPLWNPTRPKKGASDIPEALYQELKALPSLESPFDEVFNADAVRQDGVLHWLMRSGFENPDKAAFSKLAYTGTIFFGDALHPLPILGGDGANWAILDALSLADAIATRNGSSDLSKFIDKDDSQWQEAITSSKKNLSHMHGSETKL